MPINRIVVLLTPIFVGLSAAVSAWIADHFPGAPVLDQSELTAIMVVGATAALTVAAQWLHGWQKHEANVRQADHDDEIAEMEADAMTTLLESGEAKPHTPSKSTTSRKKSA